MNTVKRLFRALVWGLAHSGWAPVPIWLPVEAYRWRGEPPPR